jgi:hypothetical protein
MRRVSSAVMRPDNVWTTGLRFPAVADPATQTGSGAVQRLPRVPLLWHEADH